MRIRTALAVLIAAAATLLLAPTPARACGHDGFYMGLGYEQMFMFTPEHRLGGGNQPRITFSPGMGGNAVVGYDFPGSRWGIQLPFEFARQKLNHSEWVNQYNVSLEGVFHIKEWDNGIDFHIVGGAGWTYLDEGKLSDNSSGPGMIVSAGPGMSYYFSRTEKVSGALAVEMPLRYLYYFGSHLSYGGTSIFGIPIRISLQVGF